jgi:hypothetical protein
MGIDRTTQTFQDGRAARIESTAGESLTTGDPLRRRFMGSPLRAAVYVGVRPVPPPARLVPRI